MRVPLRERPLRGLEGKATKGMTACGIWTRSTRRQRRQSSAASARCTRTWRGRWWRRCRARMRDRPQARRRQAPQCRRRPPSLQRLLRILPHNRWRTFLGLRLQAAPQREERSFRPPPAASPLRRVTPHTHFPHLRTIHTPNIPALPRSHTAIPLTPTHVRTHTHPYSQTPSPKPHLLSQRPNPRLPPLPQRLHLRPQ